MSQFQPPQGIYPQWQPQQQSPQYPVQPLQPQYQPPPMKQRRRFNKWWLAGIVGFVVFSIVIASGSHGSSSQPVATPQTTHQPTQAKPTTQPTNIPSLYETKPLLGSDIQVFLSAYGKPDMIDSGVTYTYATKGIVASVDTGSVKHVSAVLVSPSIGTTWTASQAKTACLPYLPPDRQVKRTLTIYGNNHVALNFEYVYFSPSLVKQLPADDFRDDHFQLDTPGTFVLALDYDLGSTTAYDDCFVAAAMHG